MVSLEITDLACFLKVLYGRSVYLGTKLKYSLLFKRMKRVIIVFE